jgi:HprK-related kinase A
MIATVASLGAAGVHAALRNPSGLRLRTGPVAAKVSTRLPQVADAIAMLYGDYPLADASDFVDFEVAIRRPANLRAVWRPQVTFELEGQFPFVPLRGDQGFPMLEWGLNWCMYSMCHQYLTLHAAVLERGGRALILPAPSGSGKSTLCAGLLFNGWRLLSDELTLICPREGNIVPMPRPVSVKNASIQVLSNLFPQIRFGSRVEETNKGVVAHFPAPTEAIQKASERAIPAWIVLPSYVASMPATLTPLPRARAFMSLIENAFNYDVFGIEGFKLLGDVIDRSQCFSFQYGHLPEAIALFTRLADGELKTAN